MEKIDYNKLIDPLLIPIIKYLREEKGIETMYCCQGSTKEDTHKHGRRGYIMAKYSPDAINELLKIFNSHSSRYGYVWDNSLFRVTSGVFRIEHHPKEDKVVIVKLSEKKWSSLQSLRHEWDLILRDLTQTQD